jgi:hypothetical protein
VARGLDLQQLSLLRLDLSGFDLPQFDHVLSVAGIQSGTRVNVSLQSLHGFRKCLNAF